MTDKATIYLMGGRKCFHYELPEGWLETHYERFDYVECGIFQKPRADMTADDREWERCYEEPPEGYIWPSKHDKPQQP